MATASSRNSDAPPVARLRAGGMQQQEQQAGTRLSTEYHAETSSRDSVKSDVDETSMVLQALQGLPAISKMRQEAEQRQQGAPRAAAAAGVDDYAVTAALENSEEKREEEQQVNPKERIFSHEREQVLLWSVRRGLAPIAAAAVDGCSRGETLLETPSSASAASVTKEGANLEEETPRTSVPSSEVSPTNNFCSYKGSASSCAAAASTASNFTTWSSTSSSRITGAVDADESDNRCLLAAALQSPAEILAAAAAAAVTEPVSSAEVPAAGTADTTKCPGESTAAGETAKDGCGDTPAARVTPYMTADTVEVAASGTSVAVAAPEVLTSASADDAAVLSSPAALSLLATPCPVGGAAAGAPLCSTDTEAAAGRRAAPDGTAIEEGLVDTLISTAGINPAEAAAIVGPADVQEAVREITDAAAATDNEKNTYLTQLENTTVHGALLKDTPQELLKTLTESQTHEEEGSNDPVGHGVAAAESICCEKGGWPACFVGKDNAEHSVPMTLATESVTALKHIPSAAAEDGTAEVADKDATAEAGSAAVSQGPELGAAIPPPSSLRENAAANPERRGGPLLLWECHSQLSAAVEEEDAAAAVSNPASRTSLKMLSQIEEEQQQPGYVATKNSPDALKSVSAGLAPLLGTSCCPEFSSAPRAATLKGDISPVSCCSSSSTASVTSPTSSPLSSASRNTLPRATGGTATTAPAASNEGAAAGEAAAGGTTGTAAAGPPSSSAAAAEEKSGNANDKDSADVKTASASSSAAATRENNMPTWYVGFRLPLGAEGRQVLLRRLRRAYHAAPPTTRDAVLASHGLYFSRVPFATVSDLFKLSHLLGVFDFAVQCSHEFGGSGGGGGSAAAGGGGGSHSSKKNNHARNVNKNSSNQRQLCSGTGTAGEERKATAPCAETGGGDSPTATSGASHSVATPTAAAAGVNQRKNTGGGASRAGAAGGAAGNYGGARKGGNGKGAEQTCSTESNSAARGASKEGAAVATTGFGDGVEAPPAGGARDGATGRGDVSVKTDEGELQAVLKAATAARSRPPQQKRSAAGRSSGCRTAARQHQSEQQQQHDFLKEIEALRSVEAAAGRCSGGERSVQSKSCDWQTQQQQILLQQLLQAGMAEEQSNAASAGGVDGKNTLEAEALALLSGEFGKAAAAAAASALLQASAGGCNDTKETQQLQQQQQQLDEQLLLLQLQEHAKTSAASCRRAGSRTADNPLDGRDLRVEQEQQQQQALQCFLSEALQGRTGGLQQQLQQQQTLAGATDNRSDGRVGTKRTCRPADLSLQPEQRQWSSRPLSTPAGGEENTWEGQPHEVPTKAQLPSSADLLPFLVSAAEQLRSSGCVPSVGAAAARPSCRGGRKSEGRGLLGTEVTDYTDNSSSSSTNSSSFDWNGFLMESYLNTMREQQQQQGQTDALLFSPPGSSISANTRPDLTRAAPPVAAVAPHDPPTQPEPRLQEEEMLRLTKRPRTTTSRPTVGGSSVAANHDAPAGGSPAGLSATMLGREDVSQTYTTEEEALLSALLAAGGNSVREQQQQQRRWTLNTVDEITRLLLQLNNNSSTGTGEEIHGEDLVRRVSPVHTKDSAHYDAGCKHSSSSSCSPCSKTPVTTTYCSSNISSCDSGTSKSGCNLGFRTDSRCFPRIPISVPSAENACMPASLAGTPVDAAATGHRQGPMGAAYEAAFQSERRSMPARESLDRFSLLTSAQESFASAAEQQQPQQEPARRPLASRGFLGVRSSCSNIADAAGSGGCNKNRGQTDSSSNSRDVHNDVFLQLTSQLQLLSAQVLQQQESHPVQQQHQFHEHSAIEQQYQHHVQAQQACGGLQKGVNGPPVVPAATAAAQEETAAAPPGRLCSPEKASEYAAGVQLLQLVELLQVQHRVSRLLSLFPKAPSPAPPSSLVDPMAGVSPSVSLPSGASPSLSLPSVVPPARAGPAAAAAAFSAPDSAAAAAADGPAAAEPSASLLAALASTILEGKANAALMNNSMHASETPASLLLGLASGKTDVTNLLKSGGNSDPQQQPVGVYDVQLQQQQQHMLPPGRSPGSRGSNSKSNNSRRGANRSSNSKGSGMKTTSIKSSNSQGGERKFVSAGTEVIDDQAPAAAVATGPAPAGMEKSVGDRSAALQKQQEATMSNCVSHSNSFSTCCSDDVADLCTSGGSSSSSKSTHGGSGSLFDGICSAQPTYDRAYTHENYSRCSSQTRDNMMDICM